MLFAIDHGNSAIKTPSFVFTSGLTDYPVKPPVETDVLEFGGTFWTLSGERIPYMRDKTKDERFSSLACLPLLRSCASETHCSLWLRQNWPSAYHRSTMSYAIVLRIISSEALCSSSSTILRSV